MFFAGGGVRGGTVIGSSDKIGGYPAANPQTPENMAATIYQALGIPRRAAWHDRPAGRTSSTTASRSRASCDFENTKSSHRGHGEHREDVLKKALRVLCDLCGK